MKVFGKREGDRQHFTYSKMMAWVAFDRAIKAAGMLHANAPVERWQKVRTKIHDEICSRGYNEKLGSFVQSYGSEHLDASLLLMPLTGFLPAEDPRVKGTLKAIEGNLMSGGLVLRYNTEKVSDGLPPGEGVFLACSFWMVSALKLQGRDADARKLFERVSVVGQRRWFACGGVRHKRQAPGGKFSPGPVAHLAGERCRQPGRL